MIAGLILAAGTSSRLGRPKQLLTLGDRTVLQHVVDAAAVSGLHEIVVVLGHGAEAVAASLRLPGHARVVLNPEYATGQASSLRTGLRALGPETRAAVVLLGDQPGVSGDVVRTVVETFERTGGPVVQASYEVRPGHPVLLARRIWPEVEALGGDIGARALLETHPEWIITVEVAGEVPPDIDTWEDYRRIGGQD